jgi:hypothetical protein
LNDIACLDVFLGLDDRVLKTVPVQIGAKLLLGFAIAQLTRLDSAWFFLQ